jgi:hypothetical protein
LPLSQPHHPVFGCKYLNDMTTYGYNVLLMKVVAGILPQGIEWRVLLVLEAGQEPGIAGEIGHTLARANRGDLVIAILVSPDDSRDKVNTAISAADAFREGNNGKNGADSRHRSGLESAYPFPFCYDPLLDSGHRTRPIQPTHNNAGFAYFVEPLN